MRKMSTNSLSVQGTNDTSVVSKCAMVSLGYFDDDYIGCFVSKPTRRSPLINRGYYVRAKAIDTVVDYFLRSCNDQNSNSVQILSFGAGFDSLYFRIIASDKYNSKLIVCYEVDFPSVVNRKAKIIKSTEKLRRCLKNEIFFSTFPDSAAEIVAIASSHYRLVGVDLCNLRKLEVLLETSGINYNLPTLMLSECAITYMDVSRSNDLIKWTSSKFHNAMFCIYEQISPFDGFGEIMRQHFNALNSKLHSILEFPCSRSQKHRYKSLGWTFCNVIDMNTFYRCMVNSEEEKRLDRIEPFDEFEEFHEKCAHYVLICATIGNFRPFEIQSSESKRIVSLRPQTANLHEVVGYGQVKRYGHCSVQVGHHIITTGGFGIKSDGGHWRSKDVIITNMRGMCDSIQVCDSLEGYMHQTLSLAKGKYLVAIGGRTSPLKPSPHDTIFEFVSLDDECGETKVKIISTINTRGEIVPPPRWRHSATTIHLDGQEKIFVFGGRNTEGTVFGDCYFLSTDTWHWTKVESSGLLPCPRHSHAASQWSGKIIISGGLTAEGEPLSSLHIFDCSAARWTELEALCLLPRYSHTAHVWKDKLLLLGGVNTMSGPPPGVAVVDLITGYVHELALPVLAKPFLLNKHSSILNETKNEILLLGGGGNCFSFGTYFNPSAFTLRLHDIL